MAEENRTVITSARADGHAGASAIWESIEGHTGRKVRGDTGYALATEWAALGSRDEMLAHVARWEFDFLIPSARRLLDASLVFFRGRGIEYGAPTAEEMGPPPLDRVPAAGRYNQDKQYVLYLCDSEEGVRRELRAWHAKGVPYVQRYRLPLSELNIADFTDIPADHFVTAVFSKAEGCKVDGRGKESYDFSQVVAELVSAHFDGMRIPGVRGARPVLYSNVVLFRPYPDWPKWLEPGSSPYPLQVPVP